jgi:Ca-activated chloride channel family protein
MLNQVNIELDRNEGRLMQFLSRKTRRKSKRRGSVLMLMLFMLPVVITLAAFAINFAYMELCRTELYVSVDAAARAGGREFALTGNAESAKTVARDAAGRNEVAGTPLQLADDDFVFGESTRSALEVRYMFDPAGSNPNALQVTGYRTAGSMDGPISLMMPGILGRNSFQAQITAQSTQIEVDVALVLDRSGSMAYAANEAVAWPIPPGSAPAGWMFCDAVPPNSRWHDAVGAVQVFLTELSNSPASELVSLSTYNGSAGIDEQLTSNYPAIEAEMDVYTNNFCSGSTNIGGGIMSGINSFANSNSRPWASKVIVVLTDGIHNAGTNPVIAAQAAASQGIIIFTVTFSDGAGQALMQQVAEEAYGEHFHATTGGDLMLVFQEIARRIPTLLTQ